MYDDDDTKDTSGTASPHNSKMHKFKQWFHKAATERAAFRKEASDCYDFFAGHQWDDEDIEKLKKERRPVITFNRIGPIIDAVIGTEVQNRQEVRYVERTTEGNDRKYSEIYNGAAKWARDLCHAGFEESEAFQDCIICGEGWTETFLDLSNNPAGDIVIRRVDPLEIFPDPYAKARNLSDMRYIFRVKTDVPVSRAKEMFPDADKCDLDASWAMIDEFGRVGVTNPGDDYDYSEEVSNINHRGTVTIVHVQWRAMETYYSVSIAEPDEYGNLQEPEEFELSAEEFKEVKAHYAEADGYFEYVKSHRPVYKFAFLGQKVLKEGRAPCPDSFSFVPIYGKRDVNKQHYYGMVRVMRDPQCWANKWLSQLLFIVNSNAKGGLIAEKGVFSNRQRAEEQWAQPDSIIEVNSGGLDKLRDKPPPAYPMAIADMMRFAIDSMRDVTGVNLEMLGLADRAQPGVLEQQRKQSGVTILATYFDSLSRYRAVQGKVMLYYIREYISDGRLVRIGEVGDSQYIPLAKTDESIEYDIIVDDAPTAPNQRLEVWQMIVQMLPMLQRIDLPNEVWMQLIKYSPMPTSVSAEITKALAATSQSHAQAAQQQQQMKQQIESAGVKRDMADAEKKTAEAEKTRVETALLPYETQYGVSKE